MPTRSLLLTVPSQAVVTSSQVICLVVPDSLSDPTTVFLLRAAALYEKTVVIAHEPQSSYPLIWPSDLDGVFRDKSVAFHTDHADYASHRLGRRRCWTP